MKKKLSLIWRLTRIYLSPTDCLSMSLITVSDILNIGNHIIGETKKNNQELYPKLFATSNNFLLARLITSLWSWKFQDVWLLAQSQIGQNIVKKIPEGSEGFLLPAWASHSSTFLKWGNELNTVENCFCKKQELRLTHLSSPVQHGVLSPFQSRCSSLSLEMLHLS